MKRLLALVASLVVVAGVDSSRAADWPQWRGPTRDGVSRETGLLKEWPGGGPKLLWQVQDLGSGYSTPAVVGNRLYVISNKGLKDEFVQALATSDGKEIWSTRIGEVGNPDQKPPYPGSRSTPTVDGDRLYVLGSNGDLACLETATGKSLWSTSVRTTFGGEPGVWAYAESPLIDGETLVCTPGGKTATIVALSKKTGDPLWTCAMPEGDQAAYASVIVVEAARVKQYVQFLQNRLAGVEAKTGKLLWTYERTAKSPANIPTPVSRQSLVYSASGRGGAAAVELKAAGTGVEATEAYFNQKLATAIGGAVELNGYLYGTNGEGLLCADFKTGEIKWHERGIGAGSLLYADGLLYLHGEKPGEANVALVEATPEAYREKGRISLPNPPKSRQGQAWAYPVVANGRLYIRDWDCLWCYDIAAK